MAKRKRLGPANFAQSTVSETTPAPLGWTGPRRAAPIADVAGDAASQAAFEEVVQELAEARAEGRLIQTLPLAAVQTDHLVRDRITLEDEALEALISSLRARGQQTPIEVVALGDGAYGLISGLRRVEALRRLGAEEVQALVRAPESADAAYVAMVEENEIRVNLSFYERARIAAEAARLGIYPRPERAVQALFANASASKRSKILSFVTLFDRLETVLRFPAEIPEKLGLALVKAIDTVPGFDGRLKETLRKTPAETAAAERAALERALARAMSSPGDGKTATAPKGQEVARGVFLETGRGRVVLRGEGLDAALIDDLRDWLATRL